MDFETIFPNAESVARKCKHFLDSRILKKTITLKESELFCPCVISAAAVSARVFFANFGGGSFWPWSAVWPLFLPKNRLRIKFS